MEPVPAEPIGTLSLEDKPKRPRSADILLCHNCGWNASLQVHDNYKSHIKCSFGSFDRAVWTIGDDYVLKERPLLSTTGPKYMGPDVVTTNWVRENTTVPVTAEMRHWEDSHSHFFFMKKVPGETLEMAWPRLSTEEKKKIACEVAEYIAQLRTHTAPKPQTVDGAPARDILLSSQEEVMLLTEDKEAWWARVGHQFPRREPAWREDFKARYPVRGPYVLTHSDLNTSNIMVHDGHVSGIIDWEHAGYYPEFWEYAIADMWIEEGEWQYYLVKEFGKRFGYFDVEADFCRDFSGHELDPYIRNYWPVSRGPFCDCKPYHQVGYLADNAEHHPDTVI